MEYKIANVLAKDLLIKNNLKDWKFGFDNARSRLGCCNHRDKRISVSFYFVPIVEINEYVDILLHEIAHAIVGGKHGHDNIWYNKAIEIGCNGNRVYKGEKSVISKYVAICGNCGKIFYKHRLPNYTCSCSKCGEGKYDSKYLLNYRLNE